MFLYVFVRGCLLSESAADRLAFGFVFGYYSQDIPFFSFQALVSVVDSYFSEADVFLTLTAWL